MATVIAFLNLMEEQWGVMPMVVIGQAMATEGLAVVECSRVPLGYDQVEQIVLDAGDYIRLVHRQLATAPGRSSGPN